MSLSKNKIDHTKYNIANCDILLEKYDRQIESNDELSDDNDIYLLNNDVIVNYINSKLYVSYTDYKSKPNIIKLLINDLICKFQSNGKIIESIFIIILKYCVAIINDIVFIRMIDNTHQFWMILNTKNIALKQINIIDKNNGIIPISDLVDIIKIDKYRKLISYSSITCINYEYTTRLDIFNVYRESRSDHSHQESDIIDLFDSIIPGFISWLYNIIIKRENKYVCIIDNLHNDMITLVRYICLRLFQNSSNYGYLSSIDKIDLLSIGCDLVILEDRNNGILSDEYISNLTHKTEHISIPGMIYSIPNISNYLILSDHNIKFDIDINCTHLSMNKETYYEKLEELDAYMNDKDIITKLWDSICNYKPIDKKIEIKLTIDPIINKMNENKLIDITDQQNIHTSKYNDITVSSLSYKYMEFIKINNDTYSIDRIAGTYGSYSVFYLIDIVNNIVTLTPNIDDIVEYEYKFSKITNSFTRWLNAHDDTLTSLFITYAKEGLRRHFIKMNIPYYKKGMAMIKLSKNIIYKNILIGVKI